MSVSSSVRPAVSSVSARADAAAAADAGAGDVRVPVDLRARKARGAVHYAGEARGLSRIAGSSARADWAESFRRRRQRSDARADARHAMARELEWRASCGWPDAHRRSD